MSMTIQSSVKNKILTTPSETSKYEYEIRYHPGKANVVTDALSRGRNVELREPSRLSEMAMTIHKDLYRLDNSKEWNSGDDQLRLRWMIYLMVLADAAESVRDAIGFGYCLASSSGWTKSPVLWAEIGESSLTGLELVQETPDKVVLVKEKPKAVSPWKGVVRFGKKGKLAPRYVGPFEIIKGIGPMAY
ncbi:hypothetical protein Tco_1577680 [Tanacetum coccineum]